MGACTFTCPLGAGSGEFPTLTLGPTSSEGARLPDRHVNACKAVSTMPTHQHVLQIFFSVNCTPSFRCEPGLPVSCVGSSFVVRTMKLSQWRCVIFVGRECSVSCQGVGRLRFAQAKCNDFSAHCQLWFSACLCDCHDSTLFGTIILVVCHDAARNFQSCTFELGSPIIELGVTPQSARPCTCSCLSRVQTGYYVQFAVLIATWHVTHMKVLGIEGQVSETNQ